MSALLRGRRGRLRSTVGSLSSNSHLFLKANGGLRRTKMGIAQYDPAALGRSAWNAGRQVGVKKPLKQRQIWAIRFFLDREGRVRDRALFDLAMTASSAAAISLRSKSGPSSRAKKFELVRWSFSRRPDVPYSSRSRLRSGLACLLGLGGGEERSMTMPSPVGSTTPIISALDNMPGLLTNG